MAFSFKKHVLRNETGVLLSKMLWLQLTAAQDICVQTDGHTPLQTVLPSACTSPLELCEDWYAVCNVVSGSVCNFG